MTTVVQTTAGPTSVLFTSFAQASGSVSPSEPPTSTRVVFGFNTVVVGGLNIYVTPQVVLTGTGLSASGSSLTAGTVNTITIGAIGVPVAGIVPLFTLSGIEIDAAHYNAATASVAGFQALMDLEPVVYTGSIGTDVFTGGGFGDLIDGSGGADTLNGGGGIDDITGGAGNDTLNGGAALDILRGGADDDTYILGAENDTVVETTGVDTITSTVSRSLVSYAAVENLTLLGGIFGTGNGSINIIIGNAGANVLDGGLGADTLDGGGGNDTYVLGSEHDTVIDGSGSADTITSLLSRSLAEYATIENLILLDGGIGTGNALRNTITGNGLANTLNGGTNIDRLVGRDGSDLYVVDSTIDVVVEAAGSTAGTADRVLFNGLGNQTYLLAANVENLTLLGSAASRGTGNVLANTIVGNAAANVIIGGGGNDVLLGGAGNDVLNGGLGKDKLTGGADADAFDFTLAPTTSNRDTIAGYNIAQDTIRLDNAVFTHLGGVGTLSGAKFWKSAAGLAHDANDRVIYETDTGKLFYDGNGSAAGGRVQIAVLSNHAAITHSDIFVI
jgi:Ca2+-binding RTX toxin-like protein